VLHVPVKTIGARSMPKSSAKAAPSISPSPFSTKVAAG
jgi:hypothetical protein